MRQSLYLLFLFSAIAALLAAEPSVEAVQEKFASITSIETSFSQKTIPAMGDTQHFEGTLYLARPASVRMEIASPQEQLIVFDGEEAWLYLPEENTCYHYTTQSIGHLAQLPSYIFDPFEKLEIDTFFTADTCFTITFIAPENDPFIARVDLTVLDTSLLPCEILITDRAGSCMDFDFSTMIVNGSGKVRFTFSPPAHTEIIEQ